MERYALHFLACRAVASLSTPTGCPPTGWLTLKAAISMTTPLPVMCACILEPFPELSSIAPMECHALGCCGLQGGGLYIYGPATLTNTNVYSNQATEVRSPFQLSLNFHPSPRWCLTFALAARRAVVSMSLPTEWLILKAAISMTTRLLPCACLLPLP